MKEKDLYQSTLALGFGIVAIIAAFLCPFVLKTAFLIRMIAFAALLAAGIGAILCWKNQSAVMTGSSTFRYRTMFGNEKVYRFSEFVRLERGTKATKLIFQNGTVYIAGWTVLSERFIAVMDRAMEDR